MARKKWPDEAPVFESTMTPDYFIVAVGVGAGLIEAAYPMTPEYPTTNVLTTKYFFGKGNDYQPRTKAARELLAIAKAAGK